MEWELLKLLSVGAGLLTGGWIGYRLFVSKTSCLNDRISNIEIHQPQVEGKIDLLAQRVDSIEQSIKEIKEAQAKQAEVLLAFGETLAGIERDIAWIAKNGRR